jgi:hypothetical protein
MESLKEVYIRAQRIIKTHQNWYIRTCPMGFVLPPPSLSHKPKNQKQNNNVKSLHRICYTWFNRTTLAINSSSTIGKHGTGEGTKRNKKKVKIKPRCESIIFGSALQLFV